MSRLAVLPWATLILLGTTAPLRAQNPNSPVDLTVCNKGAISVEVVAAEKNEPLLGVGKLYYNIRGKSITPGKCAQVDYSSIGLPAYIGFGYYDALGRWGSGKISHVPDFGVFSRWFHDNKVLVGASKAMCTRKNEYRYSADGDLQFDCAGMTAANAPDATHGPFVPVTAALYFETDGQSCVESGMQTSCSYYLNISPSPSDWELHATRATSNGRAMAADDDSAGIHFLQALAKAAADERQRHARAAADSAEEQRREAADTVGAGQRRLVEQAAAREQRQKQILAADAAGDPTCEGRGADDQARRRDQSPAMGRNPPIARRLRSPVDGAEHGDRRHCIASRSGP